MTTDNGTAPQPIDDVLLACGFGELRRRPALAEVEEALVQLRSHAEREDGVRRGLLRSAAVFRLRECKVESPARLVDAALAGLGRKPEAEGISFLKDDPPADDPVDGADLLDALRATFLRFLALSDGSADALALWTVHSYTYDLASVSPRLAITSPTKRCGKTRVLEILQALARRPLVCSNASPAATFRVIESHGPTLLIDEADTFLKTGKGEHDELRGILNSGHTKTGAFVIRCEGDSNEAKLFKTWAPVAIAMIGHLPGTLEDRSVPIRMRRRAPGETIETLRLGVLRQELALLRRQVVRWTKDSEEWLGTIDPAVPDGVDDRAVDNWRPLLAIAEVAGDEWAERARAVAILLSAHRSEEEASYGIQLLADLRNLFEAEFTDRLSTEAILEALHGMDERPWPDYRRGKPITARQLSSLLRPFAVKPKQLKLAGEKSRGYLLEDLRDVFDRYLGTDPVPTVPADGETTYSVPLGTEYRNVCGTEAGSTGCDPVPGTHPVPGNPVQDNEVPPVPDENGGGADSAGFTEEWF